MKQDISLMSRLHYFNTSFNFEDRQLPAYQKHLTPLLETDLQVRDIVEWSF